MVNLAIDTVKLIADSLPPPLRSAVIQAWLKVLASPIQDINDTIVAFGSEIKSYLSYTGQVLQLERMLNNRYTTGGWVAGASNPIYIVDGTLASGTRMFTQAETLPLVIGTEAEAISAEFVTEGEVSASTPGVNFVVKIPVAQAALTNEIYAWTGKYALAGIIYSVETY